MIQFYTNQNFQEGVSVIEANSERQIENIEVDNYQAERQAGNCLQGL